MILYPKIFLVLIFFLTFFSCKPKKEITSIETKKSDNKELAAFAVLDSVRSNAMNFNSVSIKFNAALSGTGNQMETVGTLKVLNDSLFIVSITPILGIELMRMRVTKTEIIVLNRLNKTYYLEGLEDIHKMLGMSFSYSQMQALLLNELFCYPESLSFRKDYKFSEKLDNSTKIYNFEHQGINETQQSYLHGIQLDAASKNYTNLSLSLQEKNKYLTTKYSQFSVVANTLFPHLVEISIVNGEQQTNLKVEILKIELDKETNFAFSIPKKYKKMDVLKF